MFWGIQVKDSVQFQIPFDLHISTACLDVNAKGNDRAVLQVVYEDKTYAICSLSANGVASCSLDTNFEKGQIITFKVNGNHVVHLTGYFVDSMLADSDNESDDDEEGEEDEEDEEINSDEMVFEDDDDEDDDEDEEEEDEEDVDEQKILAAAALAHKRKLETQQKAQEPVKKNKIEQPAITKAQLVNNQSPAKKDSPQQQTPTKAAPAAKPAASPAKKPAASPVAAAPSPKPEEKKKGLVTLKNGLQYEDIQIGTGPSPVSGKRISVKYLGKLANGKTFDSSLNKPFSFRLGVGEVIKGWDLGFAGMKVGGKRRLVIPAALGYGSRGAPPSIPGNATLIFEVELCKTN